MLGFFGSYFYLKPAHKLAETFGGQEIFGWHPGEFDKVRIDSPIGHVVLIIGAKHVNNKAYVYFYDPNHENTIFKMSYDRLLSGILNIYGIFDLEKNKNAIGPFAYHANLPKLQYLQDFYKDLRNFIATEKTMIEETNSYRLKV